MHALTYFSGGRVTASLTVRLLVRLSPTQVQTPFVKFILLCAHANSASYPQRDGNWVGLGLIACLVWAAESRPDVADWGSGMSACYIVGPIIHGLRYCTIRYDTVYLACSKKLTCSQLSPPHVGPNSWRVASLVHHTEQTEKLKEKKRTKNKSRSMISLVRFHDREGSPG